MSTGYERATGGVPGPTRAVQRAAAGEHLCSFHGAEAEQRRLAGAFVASGLGAGERIMYVAPVGEPPAIGGLLAEAGVDGAEPLVSGQVLVTNFAAMGASPGDVDLAAVLASYREEAERSRAAGFPGLRVAAEMDDLVGLLRSAEEVVRWECVVGQAFQEMGVTALCQYDTRQVAAPDRGQITAEHGAVAVDDGTGQHAVLLAMHAPPGLRIVGELDVAVKGALARALRARAAIHPSVHVDLEAVTFADVGGVRTLFEVARELPAGGEIVLRRPPDHARRLLGLLGWEDQRVRVEVR